jgi:hypothetical protein
MAPRRGRPDVRVESARNAAVTPRLSTDDLFTLRHAALQGVAQFLSHASSLRTIWKAASLSNYCLRSRLTPESSTLFSGHAVEWFPRCARSSTSSQRLQRLSAGSRAKPHHTCECGWASLMEAILHGEIGWRDGVTAKSLTVGPRRRPHCLAEDAGK